MTNKCIDVDRVRACFKYKDLETVLNTSEDSLLIKVPRHILDSKTTIKIVGHHYISSLKLVLRYFQMSSWEFLAYGWLTRSLVCQTNMNQILLT